MWRMCTREYTACYTAERRGCSATRRSSSSMCAGEGRTVGVAGAASAVLVVATELFTRHWLIIPAMVVAPSSMPSLASVVVALCGSSSAAIGGGPASTSPHGFCGSNRCIGSCGITTTNQACNSFITSNCGVSRGRPVTRICGCCRLPGRQCYYLSVWGRRPGGWMVYW